jgi:hypothetical protein
MRLVEMETAERVAAMIPAATIVSEGEHHVLVLVIANPISAAFGLRQVRSASTQTAPGNGACFRPLGRFLYWRFAGFLPGH